MPTFEVTSPDGKTWEVNAPAGATQAQVLAYARQQWEARSAPPKSDAPSALGSDMENFKAATGKAMVDTARRAGQLVRGLNPIWGYSADYWGLPGSQSDIDEAKKRDRELMDTKAGIAGSVAGNLPLAVMSAPMSGASLAGQAAAGAGTAFLTQPVASDESALLSPVVGGAAGLGGGLLARGARALYGGAKGLLEPFYESGRKSIAGRVLEQFAENPEALKAASGAKTATGAAPMLSEATRDRGIATLERALSQQDPQIAGAIAQRAGENNAARVKVLQDMAGSPGARAAAVKAREDAAGEMYKAATTATYTVDDKLAELLRRPVVRQAMEKAKVLAQNQGRPFSFDVTPSNAFSGVGVPTNGSRQITGQGLQDLKMAMDEMLTDPASGFTGKAGDAVKGLRGQIVSWMEKANPAFKDARTAYAAQSKPINQMDVAERLIDKTTAAIRDMSGNPRLQANAYARALDNEKGLVQNATGFKGVKSLDDVMTPEQMKALNAIRSEMELSANLSNAANGPGSQTAKSLASQNLLRRIIGPTGMPQSWAESAMLQTAMRPVQFGMQAAEPKIQRVLLEAMLDPSKARALLDAANPAEKAQLVKLMTNPALIRLLRGVPTATALGASNGRE